MASVKFYLDKRSKKQDGTFPLKLTVSHQQKPFHIALDLSIPEQNWIGDKIEGSIPNKAFLNNYIRARYSAVENLLLRLKIEGRLDCTTPDKLKQMILNDCSADEQPEEKVLGESYLFREHAQKFIASREAEGTKRTYTETINKLEKLYNLNQLTFGDIDYNWLENFDIKLRPTCKVNTRSIHLRNIRAIFKNATKKKLVSKDLYPFDDFSIKTEETAHRNLSVDDLRTFLNYPVEEHQQRYRDIFMLQFYLIGINTTDLLHAEHIHAGRLEFRRAKTKRLYSIKIEPEALEIIKKYPGKKHLLDFLDTYSTYKDFHHRYSKNLKQIGPTEWIKAKSKNGRGIVKKQRYPLFPFLTSYYSRHTWATIAASLDIPKDTIAAALGHGKKSVTDIYINFDQKKIDTANRKVIDHLLNIPQPPQSP